jgi:hypothetical protein
VSSAACFRQPPNNFGAVGDERSSKHTIALSLSCALCSERQCSASLSAVASSRILCVRYT